MALDVFTGTWTAAQIVKAAETRANNPGLHLTPNGIQPDGTAGNTMMDAPAYAELQGILDHLALSKTFAFTRTAVSMGISSVINALPVVATYGVSYWRIGFSDPAWIIDNTTGQRTRFQFKDVEEFHQLVQPNQSSGMPEVGYVDRRNGTLTVDPTPDRQYTLEIHFYPWQSQLATISAKPWFPYHKYLVEALLCELYLHSDDQRFLIAEQRRQALWRDIVHAQGDERNHSSARIGLDPQYYRTPVEF